MRDATTKGLFPPRVVLARALRPEQMRLRLPKKRPVGSGTPQVTSLLYAAVQVALRSVTLTRGIRLPSSVTIGDEITMLSEKEVRAHGGTGGPRSDRALRG